MSIFWEPLKKKNQIKKWTALREVSMTQEYRQNLWFTKSLNHLLPKAGNRCLMEEKKKTILKEKKKKSHHTLQYASPSLSSLRLPELERLNTLCSHIITNPSNWYVISQRLFGGCLVTTRVFLAAHKWYIEKKSDFLSEPEIITSDYSSQ